MLASTTRFILGPKLNAAPPRKKPPAIQPYANYCFRAVCFLYDGSAEEAEKKGKIVGYDRTVSIVSEVHNACRLHTKHSRGDLVCGEPELTMLPATPHECSGQLYFHFDNAHL